MKKELFDELLESVRETKAIMYGEKQPSRIFVYNEPNVKTIRMSATSPCMDVKIKRSN